MTESQNPNLERDETDDTDLGGNPDVERDEDEDTEGNVTRMTD